MNKDEFIKELSKLNITLTDYELTKFETYKELLKEYNKKFNLTSIVEDNSIYLKHFYDSLYLLKEETLKNAKNILDIGTGAGFPGIPLAIIQKNTNITLVESNTKKCNFLNIVKEKLNLDNIEVINDRAENYVKTKREYFDIVTSRAVANLKILIELELPALKINGYFLGLKSNVEEELNKSEKFITELGGVLESVINYTLPYENSKRTIVKIKKAHKTDKKYPREYKTILKDLH